ncbi:MAG: F0F1 ATP synthase subunit delta [Anaerolineales bacterium]|nr:F0F1 ATP synthase subunit delta [Anaerolineales bacterium]
MLDLDLTTIVLEILNFLALTVGLYYLLFRPVMRRVEARAQEKARVEREMKRALQEAEEHKAELERRLGRVDEEVDRLMDEARERIERERSQMLEEIRAEAEQARDDAEADILRHHKQELKEFNQYVLDTLIALSGELIEKAAPAEVHDRLVQETNDYVWKLGKEQAHEVEALRRSLGDRTPTVHISSARALSPDQQRMLAKTFSALTDRNVNFEIETDSKLYGGVRVRVGDMLFDNSIAAQLERIRSETQSGLQAMTPDD